MNDKILSDLLLIKKNSSSQNFRKYIFHISFKKSLPLLLKNWLRKIEIAAPDIVPVWEPLNEPKHQRVSSSSSLKISLFSFSPSFTAPSIIMVAVCQQRLHNGKEPDIQVSSQPEKFPEYSSFIPVVEVLSARQTESS